MNKSNCDDLVKKTKYDIKCQIYANVINLFDIMSTILKKSMHCGITCIEEPIIFKIANKEIDKYYDEDVHFINEHELVKMIINLCVETFLEERGTPECNQILSDFRNGNLKLVDLQDMKWCHFTIVDTSKK